MLKLRKLNTVLLVVLALVLVLALVAACGGNNTPDGETPGGNTPGGTTPGGTTPGGTTPDPSKKDITGVTFENKTFEYDGTEHEITVSGTLPEGVSVAYDNNKRTDTGSQTATATLTGEGYNTLTLTATITINGKTITGVTFVGDTFTYDGTEHEIVISGTKPADVNVAYTNNKGTDAGDYEATATLTGKGYNTLVLKATLTIEKAEIATNITFSNSTVEYDGLPHSIQIVGNVPSGYTVEYYYDGVKANNVTAPGIHTVKAVLTSKNYKTLEFTAKLTITSKEEMLYSAVFGGTVYFQNSLDGNRLYSATGSGNNLTRVSGDVATYFAKNSSDLYFYSGGLLLQSIKSLSSGEPKTVFDPGRATYLACDDNGNIYYAKANLVDTKGENGIYKVNITVDEPTPVRLTTAKADFLAYYNGFIYYISNNSRLYRISVNVTGGEGTLLVDHKVSDVIVEDGYVYFTQHDTTNSAIYKYNISNGQSTKLCNDNGAYLTKINDEIYYVNKDLLTSNIFGKGIYKVSIDGAALGVGTKVIEADEGDGYYSLASDGNNLFYYKRIDKHFYRYNITTQGETDLMRDFTPVETVTFSTSPYAHLAVYNGEIYYTDVLDNNSLYKYNPETKQSFKVLSNRVSNVFFHNDTMYYSTFVFTNYALWKLDLTDPEAEPIKISSHRYENLIFVGDDIYAIQISAMQTYHNYIVKLSPTADPTAKYTVTELYTNKNVHITKLYLVGDKFHFTINPAVGYKYIYTHDFDGAVKQDTNINVKSDNLVISGSKYYYFDHTANKLMSCDFEGKNVQTLVSNLDITDMYLDNGVIYYSSKSSQNTGIYAYNISTGTNTKLTAKFGHGFKVLDGKLYFVNISLTYSNDYPQRGNGDGHLYSIDLSSKVETKVA